MPVDDSQRGMGGQRWSVCRLKAADAAALSDAVETLEGRSYERGVPGRAARCYSTERLADGRWLVTWWEPPYSATAEARARRALERDDKQDDDGGRKR